MQKEGYNTLVSDIGNLLEQGRKQAVSAVNEAITQTYWQIGKRIVVEEQKNKSKADYGTYIISRLSQDLSRKYGKGFTLANLKFMRQFYLSYPIGYAVRSQLSWTHYRTIMRIADSPKREFYETECAANKWSSRELDRQIGSLLYERTALSKDKNALLSKARGTAPTPEEQIKDPYVLEFLNLKEEKEYSESQIEQALIDNLQEFLLELGRGFAFIARQKRISINNEHYYADLMLYNRILKCLVIIDVKSGKFTHADAGQMNFYVNYFRENEMMEGENEPIGIVLCTDKNNTFVKYALGGMSNKIFASKYQLSLPSPEDLRKVIEKAKNSCKLNEIKGICLAL